MRQWKQVEQAADNNMSAEAARVVLLLLNGGNVRPSGGDVPLPPSAAGGVFPTQTGTVVINTEFRGELVRGVAYSGDVFAAPSIMLAETLMHEAKHVLDLAALPVSAKAAAYVRGSRANKTFEDRAEDYARQNACNKSAGWPCK